MYKRNVDQPTLEDHVNKAVLPKVMQVKKFGLKGRTKYTHLRDQDTSQRDTGWNHRTAVQERFDAYRGGVEGKRKRDA